TRMLEQRQELTVATFGVVQTALQAMQIRDRAEGPDELEMLGAEVVLLDLEISQQETFGLCKVSRLHEERRELARDQGNFRMQSAAGRSEQAERPFEMGARFVGAALDHRQSRQEIEGLDELGALLTHPLAIRLELAVKYPFRVGVGTLLEEAKPEVPEHAG